MSHYVEQDSSLSPLLLSFYPLNFQCLNIWGLEKNRRKQTGIAFVKTEKTKNLKICLSRTSILIEFG